MSTVILKVKTKNILNCQKEPIQVPCIEIFKYCITKCQKVGSGVDLSADGSVR